jgi:hypothetical protein
VEQSGATVRLDQIDRFYEHQRWGSELTHCYCDTVYGRMQRLFEPLRGRLEEGSGKYGMVARPGTERRVHAICLGPAFFGCPGAAIAVPGEGGMTANRGAIRGQPPMPRRAGGATGCSAEGDKVRGFVNEPPHPEQGVVLHSPCSRGK